MADAVSAEELAIDRLSVNGSQRLNGKGSALVHLAAGIGDIVLATPLLIALDRMGYVVDVWLSADYEETDSLFGDWSVIRRIHDGNMPTFDIGAYDVLIPAVPPFSWRRFRRFYWSRVQTVQRPPDALYYENQRNYYLRFSSNLGYAGEAPRSYRLPISVSEIDSLSKRTIGLLPGCKTGEMASKRWPYFDRLAERLEDVAIFGTDDDLTLPSGQRMDFPEHANLFAGKLTLRETAEALASVGIVVGNDSGLSHVAAAVGTPTIMLFGPTPDHCFQPLPKHVTVLRSDLTCQPCWFERRLTKCNKQLTCLREIGVSSVIESITDVLGKQAVRSFVRPLAS